MTQAPVISSFSPDTGNPDTTDQDVLTFVGTAPDNSTVDLYSGSTLLGTTTASSTGAWSVTTPALANGTYSFTATDIVSGVTSAASAPLVVNVVPATTVTKVAASPGSGTEFSGDTDHADGGYDRSRDSDRHADTHPQQRRYRHL